MDSVKVGLVIKDILNGSEELKRIVGEKISPLITPSESYPFVVYRRSGTYPEDSKDRMLISAISTIEICAVSDKYEESVQMASLIGDALQGKRGQIAGLNVKDIKYDSDDEDYIDGAYIQRTFFKIRIV